MSLTWTELDELSDAGVTLCGTCDHPLGTNMNCTTCAKISISVIEAILEHAPANGANDASDFLRGQVAALRRVVELGEQE